MSRIRSKFVLHNCIVNWDAEQVYLELQVSNVKNKEVTANPKSQGKKLICQKP